MLRYLRWLAARAPDASIVKESGMYMWFLPLLSTVGLVVFGPLGAAVLYWRLLPRVRKHLISIERSGVPAALPTIAALPAAQLEPLPVPSSRRTAASYIIHHRARYRVLA